MARTRKSRLYVAVMTMLVAGVAIYWLRTTLIDAPVSPDKTPVLTSPAQADAARAAQPLPPPPPPGVTVVAASAPAVANVPAAIPAAATSPVVSSQAAASPAASAALAEASAAIAAGNPIQARRLLNQVVDPVAVSPTNEPIVEQLVKLGQETIFSPRILQNDPLTIRHVVASGENLQKIANTYRITVPLICRVNGLTNPNSLRQGQPLKVPLGPFHAVVSKSTFRIALYCQDTLVKVFPVALGAEGTTPTGVWKIKNKLTNPPYYPPRGGKTIAADDPSNPLGEYWMALEGVEGEAVGQTGYGIHGTNEPDSIGKNVSLGCIRLRNEDAEQVYEMLVVRDSVVTVKP